MNGFHQAELTRPGILARLRGRPAKEYAFKEIQNKLATTQISEIPKGFVEDCLSRYGLNRIEAETQLGAFYELGVRYIARHGQITPEQHGDLERLANVLTLPPAKAQQLYLLTVLPMLERVAERAFADHHLSDDEKAELDRLSAEFRIPDKKALEIYRGFAQRIFQNEVDSALSDKRLSPDEEQRLTEVAKGLGGEADFDPKLKQVMDRYRQLWRYTQGDLPEIEVPILLQRGESCAQKIQANHHELRTVTKRIRYSGPTASIRIMKGVKWRVGDIGVSSVSEDVLKLLDSGTLYFTTKRLIFDGAKKTTSIALKKVLNFTFYANALVIEKDTGKDQVFENISQDQDMLDAILEGLLTKDRNR